MVWKNDDDKGMFFDILAVQFNISIVFNKGIQKFHGKIFL